MALHLDASCVFCVCEVVFGSMQICGVAFFRALARLMRELPANDERWTLDDGRWTMDGGAMGRQADVWQFLSAAN